MALIEPPPPMPTPRPLRLPALRRPAPTLLPAVLACAALTAGCTTVHIAAGAGEVQVERHFGTVRVDIHSPTATVAASITGLGLASTPLGYSLGWTRQRIVLPGARCGAVVFVDDARLQELVRNWIRTAVGVCLAQSASALPTTWENP